MLSKLIDASRDSLDSELHIEPYHILDKLLESLELFRLQIGYHVLGSVHRSFQHGRAVEPAKTDAMTCSQSALSLFWGVLQER